MKNCRREVLKVAKSVKNKKSTNIFKKLSKILKYNKIAKFKQKL